MNKSETGKHPINTNENCVADQFLLWKLVPPTERADDTPVQSV